MSPIVVTGARPGAPTAADYLERLDVEEVVSAQEGTVLVPADVGRPRSD